MEQLTPISLVPSNWEHDTLPSHITLKRAIGMTDVECEEKKRKLSRQELTVATNDSKTMNIRHTNLVQIGIEYCIDDSRNTFKCTLPYILFENVISRLRILSLTSNNYSSNCLFKVYVASSIYREQMFELNYEMPNVWPTFFETLMFIMVHIM